MLRQGTRYLDYTNNSDNPDEATVYEKLMNEQKELRGIVLALVDQNMFNSSVDGSLTSPMREWMVAAYSSVRGPKQRRVVQFRFVRCPPPAHAVHMYKQGRGSTLSTLIVTNEYDLNFLTGHDLGNAVYSQWLKRIMTEAQ